MGYHDGDFLVRPLDAVWLRGGQPYVAGEGCFDPGMFPPSPWTFQGIVRTRLLRAAVSGDLDSISTEEIRRLVGPPDSLPEGWRIEGAFPAELNGSGVWMPWFPTPRFLLGKGDGAPERAHPAPRIDGGFLSSSRPETTLLGNPRLDDGKPLGGWISSSNLLWALSGETRWDHKGFARGLPSFVKEEARTGVGIERKKGTAADHMLYSATRYRFKCEAGLAGRLTGSSDASIPDDALWHGWGEAGRTGAIVEMRGPLSIHDSWRRLREGLHLEVEKERVPDPVRVWVALLTPAIMTEAPQPFPVPEALYPRVKLIGRLAEEGPWIGGFSRIEGGGRDVRSTWAAGSAWLFEIAGGSPSDRIESARILQGLAPYRPSNMEAIGFGQRVAGLADPQTYTAVRGDKND